MAWYYSIACDPSEYSSVNSAGKAREDVASIFADEGLVELPVQTVMGRETLGKKDKLLAHWEMYKHWKKATSSLGRGDVVIIQFPLIGHTVLFGPVVKSLHRRGVKIVLFIHDLDGLRAVFGSPGKATELRLRLEEQAAMEYADAIIAHNERMADLIVERYGVARNKIVSLGIFDYLVDSNQTDFVSRKEYEPLVVAGNLSPIKCSYLSVLPDDVQFSLYGAGYEGAPRDNVAYEGVFPAGELPGTLYGGFGLVWDGDSSETCSGITGQYLKVNNPHKASLYLASGLPVIIWDQAALADVIVEKGCGMAVASLLELRSALDNLGDESYARMVNAAKNVGLELRRGVNTRTALTKAAETLGMVL